MVDQLFRSTISRYKRVVTTFDLRRARMRSGEEYADEIEVQLEPVELGGERYLPVPDLVPVELRVSRATTGTILELSLHARLHGPCQRCLADAVLERSLSVREYQADDPGLSEELRTEYVADDCLDLSAWARDALVLSLPDQILHRPDCAGLCATCGKDLNLEPHEHVEERGDPRWAALEELRGRLGG